MLLEDNYSKIVINLNFFIKTKASDTDVLLMHHVIYVSGNPNLNLQYISPTVSLVQYW